MYNITHEPCFDMSALKKPSKKNIGFELIGYRGVLYPERPCALPGALARMQALLTTGFLSAWMPYFAAALKPAAYAI